MAATADFSSRVCVLVSMPTWDQAIFWLRSTRYTWHWYPTDPLWNGDGSGSNCETPGDPSWFVRDLGSPTTSDVEVRLMADQDSSNEDIGVYRMELYVR